MIKKTVVVVIFNQIAEKVSIDNRLTLYSNVFQL
jgi:hypothetical protein